MCSSSRGVRGKREQTARFTTELLSLLTKGLIKKSAATGSTAPSKRRAPGPSPARLAPQAGSRSRPGHRLWAPPWPTLGLWGTHTCTDTHARGYTCPQACRSPCTRDAHTDETPAPCPVPSSHRAGTPPMVLTAAMGTGPASLVSTSCPPAALQMEGFLEEGMLQIPGFSPAGRWWWGRS